MEKNRKMRKKKKQKQKLEQNGKVFLLKITTDLDERGRRAEGGKVGACGKAETEGEKWPQSNMNVPSTPHAAHYADDLKTSESVSIDGDEKEKVEK